jgi:hypothetical protein
VSCKHAWRYGTLSVLSEAVGGALCIPIDKCMASCVYVDVGGFLFLWLPEVLLCPSGSHVPVVPGGYPWLRHVNGHAWFHLTSAAGPYVFMTFSTFNRYHCLRRAPTFHWRQPHPALLLPFRIPVVHVLSVPE